MHIFVLSEINCTMEEMEQTVDGHFTTEIMMLDPSNRKTVSGMVCFRFQFLNHVKKAKPDICYWSAVTRNDPPLSQTLVSIPHRLWQHNTDFVLQRSSEFISRLNAKLGKGAKLKGGYAEAPLAYDAVWAFALALNSTIERLSPNDLTRRGDRVSTVSAV